MQKIKFQDRINEELEGLRKLAQFLPKGKANSLQNRLARISKYAKKAQAMVDSPVGNIFPKYTQNPSYENTNEDIAARYNATQEVFKALIAGRFISLENSQEFKVAEMHTVMCNIRKQIRNKNLPYMLCAREKRPDPKRRGYNEYYLTKKQDE